MDKKFLILGAAVLLVPGAALADNHGGKGEMHKGKMHDKGAWFDEADTDGDGAVSWAEYKAKKEAWIKKGFEKKDADGDGKVTKEEMEKFRKENHFLGKHIKSKEPAESGNE